MLRDAIPDVDFDDRPSDNYEGYLTELRTRFSVMAKDSNKKLFTTSASNLYDIFINSFPDEMAKQHYDCRTCRHFIERFGGLVFINSDGVVESAIWTGDVPIFFEQAVKNVKREVLKSKVTGVFISDNSVLGTPLTGTWHHMYIKLPSNMVNSNRLKSSYEVEASLREDLKMLVGAINKYTPETVSTALTILESDELYRSDKVLGVAKWFKKVQDDFFRDAIKIRSNKLWLAVATAPEGFCHINSSMIGTLLDDIADGLSFKDISSKFAFKMSTYQRSQSAPTQGNIDQAEKIIEKLGLADSLRRRYPRLEEVKEFIWQPTDKVESHTFTAKPTGVFGNVIAKGKEVVKENGIELPVSVMTWDKFKKTILPSALGIEARIDNSNRLMALVTAADSESENILQWNNTFSWYYHGGVDAEIRKRVIEAGGRYENNEIRCSLSWDNYTDLDLHCITPLGEHIYYPSGSKKASCGGYLDIDMNAGSGETTTPVENIRWASNAPEGRYVFFVENYAQRGNFSSTRRLDGATPYKVELEVNGQVFTHDGLALEHKCKKDVFSFVYRKGQPISISNGTSSGSCDDWNVVSNSFVKVTGITTSPNLWDNAEMTHTGNHTFFLLDGCRDSSEGKGRGFFNEMLKSELKEIRKTLEAYCATTAIEDSDEATACGLGFSKESDWNLVLRVKSETGSRLVKIDRFD